MSDTIEVPVIEITDGWTVDEIETEDDCDDAFAVLTALCVDIEARMDDLAMQGKELSVPFKKAKSALRWKKAGLSVVNIKRGKIKRALRDIENTSTDQRIIQYFKAMLPDDFDRCMLHIRANTDIELTK